jgi:hypothetical protein
MATIGTGILLSPTVMAEASLAAREQDLPLEQFVADAVREKIAAAKAERYFAARRERADLAAFDWFLAKTGRDARPPGGRRAGRGIGGIDRSSAVVGRNVPRTAAVDSDPPWPTITC